MKKFLFLISTVVFFSLLSACVSNEPAQNTTSDANKVETIVAGTLSAIPTITLTPVPSTPTNTPIIDEWIWQNIDLFGLKVNLPYGWTISEVNRRAEPEQYQIYGHDCADYVMSNPDGIDKVLLFPTCGFFGGAGDFCPDDTVFMSLTDTDLVTYHDNPDDIIARFSNNSSELLARYYDSANGNYIYTDVVFPPLQGVVSLACKAPPITVFGSDQTLRFVSVEFETTDKDAELVKTLELVDKIILSMSEQ